MMPPSVSFRGTKVNLSFSLVLPGLALMILGAPAFAKSHRGTPTPTPSTLPPTSPMLAVPAPEPGASAQEPGKLINSDMSGRDLAFLTTAVSTAREQAYFIDILRTQASDPQIKSLAETLNGAQEEENKHLVKLAAEKGWDVSMEPTAALKKAGADLAKLKDSNFDKGAMDKLVAASHASLAAYESAADSSDKDIKAFAAQMLPLAEEKSHVVQKMTGAGSKAAAQLFRHSAAPSESGGGAANTPPEKTVPVATEPGDSPAPSTTPTPSPKPSKSRSKVKATASPKPAATPTPAASTAPVATPPGLTSPRPDLPPIAPSLNASATTARAPIPPPIAPPVTLPVATPLPTLK